MNCSVLLGIPACICLTSRTTKGKLFLLSAETGRASQVILVTLVVELAADHNAEGRLIPRVH
jgi:hypothetical protein